MPVVLRVGPYQFQFFASHRTEPAHIHVRRERRKAKFWLEPAISLARNERFAPHELNELRRLVGKNRAFFLEKWHEFFNR